MLNWIFDMAQAESLGEIGTIVLYNIGGINYGFKWR